MSDYTPSEQEIEAAGEAIEDAAMQYLGRDVGTLHRDDISRAALIAAHAVAPAVSAYDVVERCVMTHEGPYDFAHCQTHDKTFALGEECKFNGKVMADVLEHEAMEQRGLKMRALMELEQSRLLLGAFLATWGGELPTAWARVLRECAEDVPLEYAQQVLDGHLNMLDADEPTAPTTKESR